MDIEGRHTRHGNEVVAGRPLIDRRLVFVTGKGGVGKTSIAAALALMSASMGRRTLAVEMDAKGSLASAFGSNPLTFAPTPIAGIDRLYAMQMNTEDSLREYLRLYVPIPFAGRIGPLAKTFDFVADAAPGVNEILAIGKICWETRERHYDMVVVDAEASGHVVSQIAAPQVIGELVSVGVLRDQTEWMIRLLQDADTTGVAIVTTPDELSVNETIDLSRRLPNEAHIAPSTIIANRVFPAVLNRRQAAILEHFDSARHRLVDAVGEEIHPILDAARITEERRRTGARQLRRLDELAIPRVNVGENDGPPTDVIGHIARDLAEEFDVDIGGDR